MSVLEELRQVERHLVARMQELRPAVEEYAELERAAHRLGVQVSGAAPAAPRARRKPAQPGERRQQVLELVRANPGITVREMGTALEVDPTSLYRAVRELMAAGQIAKDGQHLRLA